MSTKRLFQVVIVPNIFSQQLNHVVHSELPSKLVSFLSRQGNGEEAGGICLASVPLNGSCTASTNMFCMEPPDTPGSAPAETLRCKRLPGLQNMFRFKQRLRPFYLLREYFRSETKCNLLIIERCSRKSRRHGSQYVAADPQLCPILRLL